MKLMMKSLIAGLAVALISGCASGPSKEDILKEQLRLAEMRAEMLEKQKEAQEEILEEKLDDVPDWYMNPPAPDATGLYGVGMASSNNLSVAIKKARLAADFEVAQQMEQELSGLEQQFVGDSNGIAREQYQSAVERFVAAVPMMGQEVAEQEVSVIDGKYTAYILSRLSFDQMDRMAERQKRGVEGTSEMKEAFMMLRERVEATQTRSTTTKPKADNSDASGSEKPAESAKAPQSGSQASASPLAQIGAQQVQALMTAE